MSATEAIQHAWDVSPRAAMDIQNRLRRHLILKNDHGPIATVAGVDVGFEDDGRTTRAAVVVLALDDLVEVDRAIARRPTAFPYVPGLLSFREAPAVLDALAALRTPPDLLVCDGQGIAHPRRLGIASHVGLLTDLPSIGVGKSRLCGAHGVVPENRGAWTLLVHERETVGAVLRSRAGVKPIYVSPGHRVGLESAIELVMRCITRYRLPETTRAADRLASNRAATGTKKPSAARIHP